ncbi:MAG: type II toxin-antitoxin system VapC family toxin [Methylobacterium sp.]
MMVLLDTNVVSELRKVRTGKAHPNVAAWSRTVSPSSLFLSVITVHELEVGVGLLERRDPVQGALLRTWLDGHVLPTFAGRCLAVDGLVARASARLHIPDPIPFRDGLIAATALVHGLTVITRNVADFAATGVPLVNPWEP